MLSPAASPSCVPERILFVFFFLRRLTRRQKGCFAQSVSLVRNTTRDGSYGLMRSTLEDAHHVCPHLSQPSLLLVWSTFKLSKEIILFQQAYETILVSENTPHATSIYFVVQLRDRPPGNTKKTIRLLFFRDLFWEVRKCVR